MTEGDGEANYAHYLLHKIHLLPHDFLALPRREKAFIMASVDLHIEAEKKAYHKSHR
ncbi:hypothetical protein HZI73_25915 [Vallitalea pronyensis]|uniref:Uncharacterized protein n=1 Tax=Vallitalea pronyensis TaxID=1348613 RepID=A0A8J8MQ15_9FIRM|nr:hypothetical protein [Vallitalea pronyensis]QUI25519.1 hypothetical protein HZI73_25915 [Vallitalea pronyensis]